jgi:hypothetical protein
MDALSEQCEPAKFYHQAIGGTDAAKRIDATASVAADRVLNHSTIETTEYYAHLTLENLKAAVNVLGGLRSGYVTGPEAVSAIAHVFENQWSG